MSVAHVVLRFLRKGAAHGYGLHREIAQLRHYYPLSNVNIYSVLRDLEEQGWADSVGQIHGSRMRRVYRITDAGESELCNWLGRPPDEEQYATRDPIALKLLMLEAGDAIDLSWLEDSLRALDDEIEATKEEAERRKGTSPFVSLTLEWQLDAYARRRVFLLDALHLSQGEPDRSSSASA